ncbi:LINE-1 type transposase domain-containing 1 [Labeo rohita]|uniref:LINE-1 type transposase domain-containing 1 n=1 Tax=Labeo rohita TaxID=84645 RepID=A0A498LT83_LABRO|nr:LINE-1 type transposase domain-containing 1 [Labeo rohita]
MSDPVSDKDFPIFGSTRSQKAKEKDKKKTTQPALLVEANANANTTEPQSDMALVLSEIKANDSRLDGITNRLDGIAGSVSSLQSSFVTLSEKIEGIETRLTEAEGRISSAEDSAAESGSQLTKLRAEVEQLQSKVDDLENRGRRKNLRIVGLPEGTEGTDSLASFLRSAIPKWLDLPEDSFTLDIERAHRAALKKTITHEGKELRFYSDLSTSVVQKRREFSSVIKTMASLGLYRGFAYPARLRCLHMGKIRLFDDPNSAKAFLDSLDR